MKRAVKIFPFQKTISAEENSFLSDAIQKAGIKLRADCNKLGLCGKCLVKILDGRLPPLDPQEESFLTEKKLGNRFRLACLYRIQGDLTVNIPEESLVQEQFILKTGVSLPVAIDPSIKKFYLHLHKTSLSHPVSPIELIQKQMKNPLLTPSLNSLMNLPAVLEKNQHRVSVVIHRDREILSVEGGNTLSHCYGLAVDLGTTTLVVELVDLNTGESVDILAKENSQARYGADVVSRIGFAISSPENAHTLRKTVIDTLNMMCARITKKNKIPTVSIYEIVIAGNTVMNHILLGLPLHGLAKAPFNALFDSLPELSAKTVGFKTHPEGKLFVAPNIQSFVGGDVSAGLIASGIMDLSGSHLFIDLGTNGEIVLKTIKGITTTSTAAGPAFEGRNIRCGMLALSGAIYKVERNKTLEVYTLGNRPARGICGTGLIDCVALFLDEGLITSKGRIRDNFPHITVTDRVFLTQKDIREIQVAVAAIKTGRNMILKRHEIDSSQLDGIWIAGAFGNDLNIRNSIRIGLLPAIPEDRIHFIGNSSLAGAKALLISSPLRQKVKDLTHKIPYFSLASDAHFQDNFIDSMDFPP